MIQSRLTVPTLLALAMLMLAAPASAQGAGMRLDLASRVRIGSADGDDHYLFNGIVGAVRLSSGEIVIANAGTRELRWYSAKGEWIRTLGREGSGPGEYRGLRRMLLLAGDSLLAEDGLAARMTLYDSRGRLARSWQISPAGSFVTPPPIGRLADGSFVAVTDRALSPPPGATRYQAVLIRYRDGAIVDTLAAVLGGESFSVPCGTTSSPGVCNMGVPYGLRTLAAVRGGRAYVGNGDRYELLRIDARTRHVDTLRRTVPEVPLEAGRRAYFVDSLTAELPEARRVVVRQRFEGAPVRRTMPFFDALAADDKGRLWLARPQGRGAAQRTWELLDENGRFLGRVELPSGLRLTQVAHDHIVGVTKDRDGVEYVEVYRLR